MNRPIRDGLSLVWRHQRLVWWIFLVNLLIGFLGAFAPHMLFHHLLDKSLYAQQFSQRFDATAFLELLSKPEVSFHPLMAGSAVIGIIFLIYMLFISGGLLTVYTDDRKLTRGEFFESCGTFFWRMIRLLICSLIPFGIVYALIQRVQTVSSKMANDSPREMQGFWVLVAGTFLCLLLALFVRAWFDLAQARTVRGEVRGMIFLTLRTLVLFFCNLAHLLFIYFAITLVGVLLAAGTWFIWLNIPHQTYRISWLLLELFTLVMVALRLWQRAATVLWYENYTELHPAPVPVSPFPLRPQFAEVEAIPADPDPHGGGQPAI